MEKEYTVIANTREHLPALEAEITASSGAGPIPSRSVDIANPRLGSKIQTHFMLTDEEAEALRSDPRVRAVEIPPEQRDDISIGLNASQRGVFARQSGLDSSYVNWGLRRCVSETNNFLGIPIEPRRTLDNPNAYSTSGGDTFGYSVAISGNYAIVGAYLEDDVGGVSSGKAYIFDVTTGSLVHTLDNPNAYDTSSDDRFGVSVAISGNYAIVGAHREDDADGAFSGKAYIFNVTTGALVHTLDNPNAFGTSQNDFFGHSVAISGNRAIVGSSFADNFAGEDDAGGDSSGKAYIFDVTTGALVYTLDNPNAFGTSAGDNFGDAVAISGNYAIVGARFEDDSVITQSGKAYIFNVTTGALVHTLDNPNSNALDLGDRFGVSVAISGNYAIVGADSEQDPNFESGKAYIFNVTTGNLLYTLDNPNAFGTSEGDDFGRAVSISGNRAIVGSFGEDDADGISSGKAYIYDISTFTTSTITNANYILDNPNVFGTSESDRFGSSVAISGNYAIVGAYAEDDAGGNNSGKAYIIDPDRSTTVDGHYEYGLDGTGVDVVIQDSGIDPAHPDWNDRAGISRLQQIDWYTESGLPGSQSANHYRDLDGHGSHCASIAAGLIYGWAKGAHIYSQKLGGLETLQGSDGTGIPIADAFDCIRLWHNAKTNGRPTVVNMSWGYGANVTGDPTSGTYRGTAWTYGVDYTTRAQLQAATGVSQNYFGGGTSHRIPVRVASVDAEVDDMILDGIHVCIAAGNNLHKVDVPAGADYNNTSTFGGASRTYHRGSSPYSLDAFMVGNIDSGAQDSSGTTDNTILLDQTSVSTTRGPGVNIFAPGTDIMAATSTSYDPGSYSVTDYPGDATFPIMSIGGTSMASPQVCGVVAQHLQVLPNLTPAQMQTRIFNDSKSVLFTTGSDTDYERIYDSLMGAPNRMLYSRYGKQAITTNVVSLLNSITA